MIKLSECEEQVMTIIWSSEVELSLQPIKVEVNARFNHEWKPQTIGTFLTRLVKKGYLSMKRKGRYFYYHPEVSLEQYRKDKLQGLVDMLYGGDVDAARGDLG